jgi:hypothetical protein
VNYKALCAHFEDKMQDPSFLLKAAIYDLGGAASMS